MIAQRLRSELTDFEFEAVDLNDLLSCLKQRAKDARELYRSQLNNPNELPSCGAGDACRRWRDAEDLVYMVALADGQAEDNEIEAEKLPKRKLLYGEN